MINLHNLKIRKNNKGFTLIEIMVSVAILSILMLVLYGLLAQAQKLWMSSSSNSSKFREARIAFDRISRNLSQATLNTYFDYKYKSIQSKIPESYYRRSDFHFKIVNSKELEEPLKNLTPIGSAVFFQAPTGYSDQYSSLNNLYNGIGYFLLYSDDSLFRPSILKSKSEKKFRLFEFKPPAERNYVFHDNIIEKGENVTYESWWKHIGPSNSESEESEESESDTFLTHSYPLAKNIISFVLTSVDHLNEMKEEQLKYEFDSNINDNPNYISTLPSMIKVTMIVVDEDSANKNKEILTPNFLPKEIFSDVYKYDDDIKVISDELNNHKINYKIFTSNVLLRG